MEQNNDNNHLYTLIKHCNEFLYRRDDYRIPSDSQSDHSNCLLYTSPSPRDS